MDRSSRLPLYYSEIRAIELSNTLSPQYNLFTPHANKALTLLEAHIVDAYTVPVQSELTGDWWTNLAGKQSNSFGLILPRCARQTAFSETTPRYRIGLNSERLVSRQRPHSEQQMFDAEPRFGRMDVQLETMRQLHLAFPLWLQRHFAHRLIRDSFLLSIRQLAEELGQYYVCSKWSAVWKDPCFIKQVGHRLKVLSLAHGASPDAVTFSLLSYKKWTNNSQWSVLYQFCSATEIQRQLVTPSRRDTKCTK